MLDIPLLPIQQLSVCPPPSIPLASAHYLHLPPLITLQHARPHRPLSCLQAAYQLFLTGQDLPIHMSGEGHGNCRAHAACSGLFIYRLKGILGHRGRSGNATTMFRPRMAMQHYATRLCFPFLLQRQPPSRTGALPCLSDTAPSSRRLPFLPGALVVVVASHGRTFCSLAPVPVCRHASPYSLYPNTYTHTLS